MFASTARPGVVRFDGLPADTRVGVVSRRYYELVGVKPIIGRLPAVDGATARAEALVSYRLWVDVMHGDAAVVGKLVTVNRRAYMIAGIAPPGFDGPENGLIWIPASIAAAAQARAPSLQLFARAGDEHAVATIAATVGPVLVQAAIADAPGKAAPTVRVARLSDAQSRQEAGVLRDAARVLGLLSLLVLIAACANTTNVLAMDVLGRAPELAVRSAIGGSRRRIARQLLLEYGCYGAIGAVATIGASAAAIRSMPLWLPIDADYAGRLNLHAGAIAIVVGVVAVAVVLAIAYPLARAMSILSSLRSVGISSRAGPGRSVGALVSLQVAQTLVLLTAAVTLWRSEAFVRAKPLGFDPRSTTVFVYSLPRAQYDSAAAIRFRQRVLQTLATVPGIVAGVGSPVPVIAVEQTKLVVPGHAPIEARRSAVSPDYFAAMGTRFIAGRSFSDDERAPELIVSSALATELFGAEGALGRSVRLANDSAVYTITGIVENGTYGGVDPVPYAFTSAARRVLAAPSIVVRSSRPRREVTAAVAAALRAIDPDVPATELGSLAQLLDRSRILSVMMRALALAFCALAIIVSSFGLYVHLSRYVSARTGEIGLRLALGATPRRVVADVAGHCARMTGIGVVAGVIVSLWTTSWLSTVAIGVRRADPIVLAWAIGVTLLVALVAAVSPSWRAARVDPAKALAAG